MTRSRGSSGWFGGRFAPVASSRLTNAVAASLAIAAFAVVLSVAFAMMSIKVAMAMPIGI
jgi:hypothetical protein